LSASAKRACHEKETASEKSDCHIIPPLDISPWLRARSALAIAKPSEQIAEPRGDYRSGSGFWAIHDENALLLSAFPGTQNGHPNGRRVEETLRVRFGSKADISTAIGHVRFTPKSGLARDLGDHPARRYPASMSALPGGAAT
jgi:hypothetical protein